MLLSFSWSCVEIDPQPIDAGEAQEAFLARDLSDPRLERLAEPSRPWPPEVLELADLVHMAWLLSPALETARQEILAAGAETRAAGAPPNPTLGLIPARVTKTDAPPWIYTVTLEQLLDPGGQHRRAREVAEQGGRLAELELGQVAWDLYRTVRDAYRALLLDREELELDRRGVAQAQAELELARTRLDAGDGGRAGVLDAEIELQNASRAVARGEARLRTAHLRLAQAFGLTAAALSAAVIAERPLEGDAESLATPLLDRLDIRRALARYEQRERELALELARQVPGLRLAPGFEYDQGARKWSLGLGFDLPLFNRNRGPIEAALAELAPTFEEAGIELVPGLHRPANFVETSVQGLAHSLWIGAALVALVLIAFLWDPRVAFISMTAIPLSLLAGVLVLMHLGYSLNTMTLGGLAIAIGEVVDDAIIDVENIVRRLGQNAALGDPRPAYRIVLDASLEVRTSVVYATFVVILVFYPILSLGGLAGRFFAPLGIAYIAAVLASLAVALTVTPALSLLLLKGHGARTHPPWVLALRGVYGRMLAAVLDRPRAAIVGGILLTLLALGAVPLLGTSFLPDFREGHFVLQVSLAPGASIEETLRVGKCISDELLRNPHIALIEQQVGRTPLSEDPWGPNRSEFHIELARLPARVEAGVGEEIREVVEHIPGIQSELLTFLGDRIGETISGETAEVAISVFGDDLEGIEATAREVAALLERVPGAVDVQLGALRGQPSVGVRLRREDCIAYGLAPAAVLETIKTAFGGTVLGQIHEGSKTFDVEARLAPQLASDPERIGDLLLASPRSGLVPLRRLAEVHAEPARSMILHAGGRRRQTVTCNVEGRDVGSFVEEAKGELDEGLTLAAGSYLEWSGAAEEQGRARRELGLHSGLALVGILLLLSLAFKDPRLTALMLANLPFAFVGGIAAVFLTGGTLSMGSMVGFVTLLGITMRNSIMMISHQEHLVEVEGYSPGPATIIQAASERLAPILMTALVTGMGLLPIALGSGSAGREIEGPMAWVILGGLISSTLLNLLVLPSLYAGFGRPGAASH